ncbi:hypothetical protein EK21DRAFT_73963 [Setomelanomma holmii]|uniref:Uncharacterized protein n=1 Tax=Setomelanomma holmii TaxID=210430 RepID=A0A9P4H3L8_9PLEO|nr:hypothetical protein EK21DRAFT_73963 [Setomelanomma holmii]
MFLSRRDYCVRENDGDLECFEGDPGFWYTDKGQAIKWAIFGGLFFIFMAWFVGGYIHAKRRLSKGQKLLGYHRFLISYSERKRHGQVPQNHFTFYAQQQQGYYPQGNAQPYTQRPGGPYAEPPPQYFNNDAPPQYFAPAGATKANGNQNAGGMEMPQYGAPPQSVQESGVVGGSSRTGDGNVEQGQSQLPPRPQQAKAALRGFVDRFRR